MIYIHFIGEGNKPEKLLIHAGIVKSFTILNNSLVLQLKRSQVVVKTKKNDSLTNFEWAWTKNVNDITNYTDVWAFLKTLNLNGKPSDFTANIPKEDIQGSLF